ncbi:YkyA family protein [Lacticaseibacillus sp. GG6-2]
MKKLWIPLLGLALLLSACTPRFDQKSQLKDNSTTVIAQVAAESRAIQTINTQVGDFPATFTQAYGANANTDFQNTGAVSELITKRENAYQKLEKAQNELEAATNRLTKIANQNSPDLPKAEVHQVLTTLRLAKLDHKTFDAYYKELTSAEDEFFNNVAANASDKDSIEDALTQLNQYDSSLSQQADIVQANLQSVTADAQALQKAVAKMP